MKENNNILGDSQGVLKTKEGVVIAVTSLRRGSFSGKDKLE